MLRGLAGRLLILNAMPGGGAGLSTRMRGKRRYGKLDQSALWIGAAR